MNKYTLLDPATNVVVNIIVWDGETPYDPSPLIIRPFKETDVIGEPAEEEIK